jgi:hypothetical protein
MPPPDTTATRCVPSDEDAKDCQFVLGAPDNVQFVPEFVEV